MIMYLIYPAQREMLNNLITNWREWQPYTTELVYLQPLLIFINNSNNDFNKVLEYNQFVVESNVLLMFYFQRMSEIL